MKSSDAFEKWNCFYRDGINTGQVALWPNESLVRLLKGAYFPWHKNSYAGDKVIDIGFGSGNNLMLCGSLGMSLFGTEIHSDICLQTADLLSQLGYSAELKEGHNRSIPFDNETFDYLISWDVVHYEGEESRICDAFAEYARVLKTGGRMFLSTVAPEHTILKNSTVTGPHQYKIGRDDDFRKGQVFFYFDSSRYLEFYLSPHFSQIQIGRSTLNYFFETNDTFLVTATKT